MYPNTRRSAFVALALVLLISPPSPAPAQSLCNPPEEGPLPGFATQVYDAIQDSLDFLRRQHALNLRWRNLDGMVALAFMEQPRFPGLLGGPKGFRDLSVPDQSLVLGALRRCINDYNGFAPGRGGLMDYLAGPCLMALSTYRLTGFGEDEIGAAMTVDQAIRLAAGRLINGMHPQHGGLKYGTPGTDMSSSPFGLAGISSVQWMMPEAAEALERIHLFARLSQNLDGSHRYRSGGCAQHADCVDAVCPEPGADAGCGCFQGQCRTSGETRQYLSLAANWVWGISGMPIEDRDRQRTLAWIRDNWAAPNGRSVFRNHGHSLAYWSAVKGLEITPEEGPEGVLTARDIGGLRDPVLDGYGDEVRGPDNPHGWLERGWWYDIAYVLLAEQVGEGVRNDSGDDIGGSWHGEVKSTVVNLLALMRTRSGASIGGDPDAHGVAALCAAV